MNKCLSGNQLEKNKTINDEGKRIINKCFQAFEENSWKRRKQLMMKKKE